VKVSLLVEFEIPPRPNFPADAESIVANTVLKVLRSATEADCVVRVSVVPAPLAATAKGQG
jgi:hypothetical protein